MQKYVMVALLYTTASFGAQTTTRVAGAQVLEKQYQALFMGSTAAKWSSQSAPYVPEYIEQNWFRHAASIAALLDEAELYEKGVMEYQEARAAAEKSQTERASEQVDKCSTMGRVQSKERTRPLSPRYYPKKGGYKQRYTPHQSFAKSKKNGKKA